MLSQEQQEKILGAILKKSENANCADCNSKSPCWASLDFGVFVCMNCSGAHRALGPSTTRVKSTKLDVWNQEWLVTMQLGNSVINQYFQHNKSSLLNRKPNLSSNLNQIKKYVNDKYVRKLFVIPNQDDPITNLKNGKPPIKQQRTVQKKVSPSNQNTDKESKNISNVKVKEPTPKMDLLDDFSNSVNQSQSMRNQMIKQEINLFEFQEEQKTPKYNKEHFNSFSGRGAQHSTTGQINFESLFNHHNNGNQANKANFSQFTKIGIQPQNNAKNNPNNSFSLHQNQYNQPNQQNDAKNYFSQSRNAQGGSNTQPHVTMNINMNMQPMFMNINMNNGNCISNQHQAPPISMNKPFNLGMQTKQCQKKKENFQIPSGSLNQPFTLDVQKKQAPKKTNDSSSWVDAWK